MRLHRVQDTAYIDNFAIPSLFDNRVILYKEWHDFAFYDGESNFFGLLNFGVHGNPYDAKRGYGSVLSFFVDPRGKIVTNTRLIPLKNLQVSWFNPDFLGDTTGVTYADNTFRVHARMEKSTYDLDMQVTIPPFSNKEVFLQLLEAHVQQDAGMHRAAEAMNKQWDTWLGIPGLHISGVVNLNGNRYPIHTCRSFHDHEGGRFDWDAIFGWDTGVVLCDPSAGDEPKSATFLFYRYGNTDDLSYGGIIIETKEGNRWYFDSNDIRVFRTDKFTGEQKILPGIIRLLYPDYHPVIPKRIVFTAVRGNDTLKITFSPKAVCSIVVSSISGKAEVVFNEMFCDAKFQGCLGGISFNKIIPCWFESVRPRKECR
jgi:hypothetical protein